MVGVLRLCRDPSLGLPAVPERRCTGTPPHNTRSTSLSLLLLPPHLPVHVVIRHQHLANLQLKRPPLGRQAFRLRSAKRATIGHVRRFPSSSSAHSQTCHALNISPWVVWATA